MKTHPKTQVEPRVEQSKEVVNSQKSTKNSSNRMTPSTEFGQSLKDLLGKTAIAGQLSEEELFAASAHKIIKDRYGNQTAEDFKSAFRLNMVDKPAKERYPSAERSAKEALKFFVKSSLMTSEEVKGIRELASEVAQLDDNRSKLWDNWGNSRAVTSFSRGEQLVQSRLQQTGATSESSPSAGSAHAKTRMAGYSSEKPRMEASKKPGSRRSSPKVSQEA